MTLSAAERRARLQERFGPWRAIEPLAPDASTRAFFRLRREDGTTAVLMVDEKGGHAAIERMARVQGLFADAELPVPAILDRDDELHALLFEDLGSRLLADELPNLSESQRGAIYEQAAAIAARIAGEVGRRVDGAGPLAARPLARERLRIELAMFATHDVGGRRGVTDRALLTDLGALLDRIADEAAAAPAEFAHRDLHARNLVLRDDGTLGLLDFQDALFAPRHYDLASLLFDPYVETDEELRARAADRYRRERGFALDPLDDPRFVWVALQRLLKAIGTYAFQVRRAGRARFAAFIEPAERRVLALCPQLPGTLAELSAALFRRLGFAP